MASKVELFTNGSCHSYDSRERLRKVGCTEPIILEADQRLDGSSSSSSASKIFGPLSKEEAEQLQLEANEETTCSEDLRLFLQVSYAIFSLKHGIS